MSWVWGFVSGQFGMCFMLAPFPQEFREDVLRVVAAGESGVTIRMIAKDFGISAATTDNWLKAQKVESGEKPGVTKAESQELRELRKRNRLLEQEVEVLRRAVAYLSQANLPGKGSTRL